MPRKLILDAKYWCCVMLACLVGDSGLCAAESKQKAERLDTQVRVTLDYLLYLPQDYEQKDNWPLMLFLHGAGERGSDLELVKKHGPPKLIEEGEQFPFIVVSPQCALGSSWNTQYLELTALLDDLGRKLKVDADRVWLCGLSMGGFGTWALAAYSPQRFAALVPICGGGEVMAARRLTRMPIWAFHGAKDAVVPLARSQQMVDALKDNKQLKFTVYPDANHDSWSATFANPELYEWLLKQNRSSPAQ
ncbi:MAG TPA: dienelactone hydrolase family protein [Pirellulales bacterium]|nr:dienelactone hydrolase family protein [Pirellulales bacterium]